nr:RecQ family zinc-binding domain-containing protein [Roseibacillus sp.]
EGYIVATTPFYTTYRVKFLRDLEQAVLGHDEQTRRFLRDLFATGKHGRTWITIDPAATAEQLHCHRDRIIQELASLESHADIALKPGGIRHGYRRLRRPSDLAALTGRLQQLFLRREEQDLQRLQQVLAYAEEETCLSRHLLGHFGEDLPEPCGHCSPCLLHPPDAVVPGTPSPDLTPGHVAAIQTLLEERHGPLRSPRQLARFLCGLTSPATSRTWVVLPTTGKRARLNTHDTFSLLEDHPFRDVLAYCESVIIP